MQLVTVSIRDANRFVHGHHRHAGPVPGAKFALAAASGGGALVGVALVGRPVARALDDGRTLEVRRLCTTGTPNAYALLLGAAWRAATALGYRRLVTYTLASEPGASVRAAGFRATGRVAARSWSCPSRAPHRQASAGRPDPLGDLLVTGPLRILSLGAGVQSSTCLLMSLAGELPRLDAAVFADTGWEPKAVYQHLARLEVAAAQAGVPIYRVTAGNLRRDALDPAHRFASLPLYVRRQDGRRGMIRRQCTREHKLTPIRRQVRRLYEQAGRPPVEQWLGISADEAHRMRDSDVRYIILRYPLVQARMSRADCQQWLTAHGWPDVPRSSCIGCPFHADRQWRQLRDRSPREWADAVAFDRAIRHGHPAAIHKTALRGKAFLHRSLRPLDQVDLTPADDADLDGFGNDCQGLCGV